MTYTTLRQASKKTVVETLVEKTMDAAAYCGMNKIAVAGGVSANSALAAAMEQACAAHGYSFIGQSPFMYGQRGDDWMPGPYYMALEGHFADLTLNAKPALAISSY